MTSWPFLVAIAAILSSAIVKISRDFTEKNKVSGKKMNDILDRMDDVEADRDRLRRRVEMLEAIVTDEGFEIEREARALLDTDHSGLPTPASQRIRDLEIDDAVERGGPARARRRTR